MLKFVLLLLMTRGGDAIPYPASSFQTDSVQQAIIDQLITDQIIEANEESVYFFVLDDKILTNGSSLGGPIFYRYLNFMRQLGVQPEENWGFYKTHKNSVLPGLINPETMNLVIELYEVISGRPAKERRQSPTTAAKPPEKFRSRKKKVSAMHLVIAQLREKLMLKGIISKPEEQIQLQYDRNQMIINDQVQSLEDSKELVTFLKNKGVEIIGTPFELNIKTGEEHWSLQGTFVLNLEGK